MIKIKLHQPLTRTHLQSGQTRFNVSAPVDNTDEYKGPCYTQT